MNAPVSPCAECGYRGVCGHIRAGDLARLRASLGFTATNSRVAGVARRVLLRSQDYGQDWCQDEAIRPTQSHGLAADIRRNQHEDALRLAVGAATAVHGSPPTVPTATVADLTRIHPALAGPVPCQGTAA